ncbi:MAG: PaaI family thioesterase [FCB group bacterium]|jgi:uncharacterized protein (TIGR00369 family)|nr:PaaI family thioesterase [FCB group bacterium]
MSGGRSKRYLPNSKSCFVCGEENVSGLQTRFYIEDDVVKAPLRPAEHHCGYANIVHGGITAAILDECMGWAASRVIQRMCFTADLSIRYLKHVPGDRELTACAQVVKGSKRLVQVTGWLQDAEGTEYARAEGRFVPLSAADTLKVDDALLYRGGEERVFDQLRAARQPE